MTAHYTDDTVTLHYGDNRDVLAELADNSVDAIVTDPPYELGFMGKGWDSTGIAYDPVVWAQCLRVLKPGGHLLAFGGTRTWHRLACAIEDAGFDMRDSIAWLYGSGFPKSLDVSKAIDKAAGAARELTRPGTVQRGGLGEDWDTGSSTSRPRYDQPATPDGEQWAGWGTALKPAFEPIVVARKPLVGTVAANVLRFGTGALNIDACRVETSAALGRPYGGGNEIYGEFGMVRGTRTGDDLAGRWPANVVLDDTQADALDQQAGTLTSGANPTRRSSDKVRDTYDAFKGQTDIEPARGADSGGASRFFPTFTVDELPTFIYHAKAPTSERPRIDGKGHVTVKPLGLIRWLVKLVTPPGGTVADPFAGSGTTGEACIIEGFQSILIENDAEHLPLIVQRVTKPIAPVLDAAPVVVAYPMPAVVEHPDLFGGDE